MRNNNQDGISLAIILLVLGGLISCTGLKTVHIKPDTTVVVGKKSNTIPKMRKMKKTLSSGWSENKPASIFSDRMTYHDEGKVTIFEGRVKVIQEGLELQAPYLRVSSASGRALAKNGIKLIDWKQKATIRAGELEYQEDLSHVTAKYDVVFISEDDEGNKLKLISDQLDWRTNIGEGQVRGAVVVYYKQTTATAGIMTFSDKYKKIILKTDPEKPLEKPVVIQEGVRIIGDQITLKVNEKIYIISGNAEAVIDSDKTPGTKGQEVNGR